MVSFLSYLPLYQYRRSMKLPRILHNPLLCSPAASQITLVSFLALSANLFTSCLTDDSDFGVTVLFFFYYIFEYENI